MEIGMQTSVLVTLVEADVEHARAFHLAAGVAGHRLSPPPIRPKTLCTRMILAIHAHLKRVITTWETRRLVFQFALHRGAEPKTVA